MDPNSGLNLIGHGPIDYLVLIGMGAWAFWIGLTNPRKIIWLFPAAATFYFFVKVVTLLTPIKIVPALFLLGLSIRGTKGGALVPGRQWHIWLIVVALLSTIWGLFQLSGFQLHTPSPHVKTRWIVQLISYLNYVLIYIVAYRIGSWENGYRDLLRSFIYTSTILCIYGVYQWVASQTGLPMRGIVYTEFTTRAAIDIDNFIFRINSLANEPKRLSYVLMAAVVILLSLQKDYKLFFRKKWMLWGCIFLHVICTFWTYSTSIYISIAVFFGLMLVKSYRAAYHRYYYKISVLIVFGVVAILALSPGLRERLMLIYELRVESQLNQLEGDLYVRTEVDAIEYLKLHPYQAVLGLGPGNYNFAVEEAFGPGKGVNGGVLFALNSALLTLLMDFGIFGFILFGRHFFTHILDRPRYHSEIARKTAIPLIIFFFCVCITLNPLMIYFFFLGALDANLIREPITQAIT